jgi:hypothetical protein
MLGTDLQRDAENSDAYPVTGFGMTTWPFKVCRIPGLECTARNRQ